VPDFMPKFSLFFQRILPLSLLFLVSILTVVSIDLSSAAMPDDAIVQKITSPGLGTPSSKDKPVTIPVPTPGSKDKPVIIPVPTPQSPNTPPSIPSTIPTAPINHANRSLTPVERDKISTYLRDRKIATSTLLTPPADPRFILHDTSVLMSASALERERLAGRGPLGLGVNNYLPRDANAVLARPNFYEPRRPTTTEFEKASDILDRDDREKLLRQVWGATNGTARRQALDTALASLGLNSSEIAREQKEAQTRLNASSGRIFTTATWAVESICNRYNNGESEDIAISDSREETLGNACGPLTNYFTIRNNRVKSSVTTEIVQVGARSEKGNQNTCDARNGNIAAFPNPAYSNNQYERAQALYLRATLAAGKYPQTTTHFALDTFDPGGHCDPRCFNLTKLYNSIATTMGHAQGSTYGITPSYGTQTKTNNIWWNDRICHSPHP
jgi:hypothetical protein